MGVLTDLLGKLDTERHSAAELDTLVEEQLGNLSFFTDNHAELGDPLSVLPLLVVGASSLSERVDQLATLPSEVWGSTRFDDTDRMREILQQKRVAMAQAFANGGHAAAMARISTQFTASAVVADRVVGVNAYLFLKDLLAHWDERKDDLSRKLCDLCERIFCADGATVSFVGPRDDLERFWATGGTLGLNVSDGDARERLSIELAEPRDEAFVIPSDVSYVVEGAARSERDLPGDGGWQVVSRILSLDYLWNEVRVKGGAYGVGFRRTLQGSRLFWSYRDPNVDGTLARYEAAAEWLSAWEGDADELGGYVVSCVAAHDAPAKPRSLARRQDGEYFGRRPEGWREQLREQELSVTTEDVRAAGAALAGLAGERRVCVFGPREAIEASGLDLHVTELMGD